MTTLLLLNFIDEILLWLNTWSEETDTSNKYWKVVKTKNKGHAMFAKTDIPAYSIILMEKALLYERKNRNAKESIGQSLLNDFNKLSPNQQEKIKNLSNIFADGEKENEIEGIYDTNGCQTNASSIHISALFPKFARLNHSCLPNCTMYFKEYPADCLVVKTLFDVTKDTELTVSYLPRLKNTFKERQTLLSERYRFLCDCCLCSNGEKIDNLIKEYRNSIMNSDKHWNCAQTALDILNKHFKSFPTVKANVLCGN